MFDTKSEKIQKLLNIAREILVFSRNSLLVNYRFLDMALGHLDFVPLPLSSIGTNGKVICYNPNYVINAYKECQQQITRDYLHAVFHCILKHFEISHLVDPEIWDLATDIAVENAINEIEADCIAPPPAEQKGAAANILEKVNMLTAEKVYRWLIDSNLSKDDLDKLRKLFSRDDHSLWYMQDEQPIDDENKQKSSKDPAQGAGATMQGDSEGENEGENSGKQQSSASASAQNADGEDGNPKTFADYIKQFLKKEGNSPVPDCDQNDLSSW